jgi:hypothetical protein
MATFKVNIVKVITNGPYAYAIWKKDTGSDTFVGQKSVISLASISAALDGVKADIGSMLGSEVVQLATMNIESS